MLVDNEKMFIFVASKWCSFSNVTDRAEGVQSPDNQSPESQVKSVNKKKKDF